MEKKLKVVWICHFSDAKTRSHIAFSRFYYLNLIRFVKRKPFIIWNDTAVWVTNAIREFEKFDDIELTVIFPHQGIKGHLQTFFINGVNYKCFRSEDDNWIAYLLNRFLKREKCFYYKNRDIIRKQLSYINPDIVHIIGAENPYYSISALDIPSNKPSVVSLQTLMSAPDFLANYPISKVNYEYRAKIEREVIKKCNYIASPICHFKEFVIKDICPHAIFLKMTLAVGQDIDTAQTEKEYDFVYFAADISKAADDAIEAFALASARKPGITLNISGNYSPRDKMTLDKRIEELRITKQVFFTGGQSTHNDVLCQIKKSRVALLPLKVDMISGTIREAMACGLPVVTTITPSTPELNAKRTSVLLSEKGDYAVMADNMIKVLENNDLWNLLRRNGMETIQEKYSNKVFMNNWRRAYYEIVDNFINGVPFSKDLIL